MSKKLKTLLLALAGVLVLVAAVVILTLTDPKDDSADVESAESTEESTSLIAEDIENFSSLTINNETGTIEILPEEREEINSDGEEETKTRYIVQSLRDYDQTTTGGRQLLNALLALSYDSIVEDSVSDLSKYGLDDPLATVSLTCGDNTYGITLGMHNVSAGEYYMMLDGDDHLYTVSENTAEKILNDQFFYVETELTDSYDSSSEDMPTIHLMQISRPDLEKDIILEPYEEADGSVSRNYTSSYVMISPVHAELNYHVDDEYLPGMFGLSVADVVGYYDEADAAEYGFDEPSCELEFDLDAGDLHLTVGKVVPSDDSDEDDESDSDDDSSEDSTTYYYVLVNNNGLLYTMDAEDMSFMTVTANDMVTSLPVLPNISQVDTMTVELDGQTYVFDIQNEYNEEDEKDETVGVTYNGEELDLDTFRTYYQLMLSSNTEDINLNENDNDPVFTVTYQYSDGGEDVLAIYPMDDDVRRMQVAVNGDLIYEGRIAYLEKVRTETQDLLNGGEVDTDW